MTGLSNTSRTALDRASDPFRTARIGRVTSGPRSPQPDQQIADQGGVLGGAFDQGEGMLGAVDADAQRDHAQLLGESDPVDHDRDQVRAGQVGGHHLDQPPTRPHRVHHRVHDLNARANARASRPCFADSAIPPNDTNTCAGTLGA